MSLQLTPCLIFNGNCAEAMSFYQKVFGGELTMLSYAESPDQISEYESEKIMHALLSFNENELNGRDFIENEVCSNSNNTALNLEFDDHDEALRVFTELFNGEKIEKGNIQTLWGSKMTLFSDKFGIQWIINII